MRTWFFIAGIVLGCFGLHAENVEAEGLLSFRVVLDSSHGYFVLSDGSSWDVVRFEKRWRNPIEWWNQTALIKENYECTFDDWGVDSNIQVVYKKGNLDVKEGDASNQTKLAQCYYLLINTTNGKVLFGSPVNQIHSIAEIAHDAYEEAYIDGRQRPSIWPRYKSVSLAESGISLLKLAAKDSLEDEKSGKLISKVAIQNNNGFFVLSDGSCWKVMGFEARTRTPTEWWNNEKIGLKSFDTAPQDWQVGDKIDAYPKNSSINHDEHNASNEDTLNLCTHFLVNNTNGKVLYGIFLSPSEIASQVYDDAYYNGFYHGWHGTGIRNLEKKQSDSSLLIQ